MVDLQACYALCEELHAERCACQRRGLSACPTISALVLEYQEARASAARWDAFEAEKRGKEK